MKLAAEQVAGLFLVNRTQSKAGEVAAEIRLRFPAVAVTVGYPPAQVDLLINATSLGLKPADPLPLDLDWFPLARARAVYDTIYRPAITPLLAAAQAAGCRTANGLGMLLHQGAAAFEIWTGRSAPSGGDAPGPRTKHLWSPESIFNLATWEGVPFHFWSAVFFVFGCVIGSFLNVCIHRMPLEMSLVTPPSHCPHCKYAIPFYLNIPLVTWVVLRGRCKNCGAPISFRYFLVELLTGLAFLSCWLKFGVRDQPLPTLPLAFAFAVLLAG